MANMSYCRFENTASDLADCADHIREQSSKLSSDYEREARLGLVKTCVEILETLGFEITDPDYPGAVVNHTAIRMKIAKIDKEDPDPDDDEDEE